MVGNRYRATERPASRDSGTTYSISVSVSVSVSVSDPPCLGQDPCFGSGLKSDSETRKVKMDPKREEKRICYE
jgi:hypothetical protein